MLRKEVDPGSGVYIVHDVFAVGHHALFVLTGDEKHLDSLLHLIETKYKANDHTAAHLLTQLGPAAAAVVPATRRLLARGDLEPQMAKKLEGFIAKATARRTD